MSHALPRYLAHEQRIHDSAKIAHILETTGGEPVTATTHKKRNATGDTRTLRMIPVTARGVGGTIPGTEGYAAVIAEETRRLRTVRRLG